MTTPSSQRGESKTFPNARPATTHRMKHSPPPNQRPAIKAESGALSTPRALGRISRRTGAGSRRPMRQPVRTGSRWCCDFPRPHWRRARVDDRIAHLPCLRRRPPEPRFSTTGLFLPPCSTLALLSGNVFRGLALLNVRTDARNVFALMRHDPCSGRTNFTINVRGRNWAGAVRLRQRLGFAVHRVRLPCAAQKGEVGGARRRLARSPGPLFPKR